MREEPCLSLSEQQLTDTLSPIPCGLCIYRVEGDRLFPLLHNPEFYQLMGFSPDHQKEIEQETFFLGVHPEDLPLLWKQVQESIHTGSQLNHRYRQWNDARSEYRWIQVSGNEKYLPDGTLLLYHVYRDITPDILSQQENHQLRQYFQTILSYLPGGVVVIRYDFARSSWIPEFMSNGFFSMSGMTSQEAWDFYGQDATNGMLPEERTTLAQTLQRCINNGIRQAELTYHLHHGQKGLYQVQVTLSLVEDEEKNLRVYAIYHDMTQELEKRELLRQQYRELLFRHYHKSGPDVLLTAHCNVTQNRIIEMRNDTSAPLAALPGSSRDTLFEELAHMIQEPSAQEELLSRFPSAAAQKAYQNGQNELTLTCFFQLPQDLHGRYVQLKTNLLEDPDTRELTGILSLTDVTEATISARILQQLSVSGYDLTSSVDLFSDHYINLSCLHPHEQPFPEGSFSRRITQTLPHVLPEDQANVQLLLQPQELLNRLKAGPLVLSYTLQKQDGEPRTKQLTISPVDLRIGRICLARSDITDSLASERQKQQALETALSQAKQANQAKSDFLSSMSHDIRTPLNAITGMTALALAHKNDPERLTEYLRQITLSSDHLLALINDILDMNKIEHAKVLLHREELCMTDLTSRLAAILQPQAEQTDLSFSIRSDQVNHKWFRGDSLRISQILINLLGNAIKFTPSGGSVSMTVEELPTSRLSQVRYLFTIQDTGIGMTKDFQKQLFEPFSRDENAAQIDGSGLGLSIAYGLIQLMHGSISVESEPQKGSTFHVELEFPRSLRRHSPSISTPIEREGSADKTSPEMTGFSTKNPDLTGFRFLIAEDNVVNAEILCELLKLHGALVEVCVDGQQTVQTFWKQPVGFYHAILMDIRMPNMDGYEATRAIRSLPRKDAASIPIIAMTANVFDEDVRLSLEAGMNAHVSKPLNLSRLWTVFAELLPGPTKADTVFPSASPES